MARTGEHWREGNEWVVVTDEVRSIYDEPESCVRIRRRFKTMKEALQSVSPYVRKCIREIAREKARSRRFSLIMARREQAERRAKEEFFKRLTAGLTKLPYWDERLDHERIRKEEAEGTLRLIHEERGFWEGAVRCEVLRVYQNAKGRFLVVDTHAWNATYYVPQEYLKSEAARSKEA